MWELITVIVLSIGVLGMFGCVFFLFKNNNTYRNQGIIINAIHRYKQHELESATNILNLHYSVNYYDMEPYEKTLFRFWDWGYENILPKDKFEIIKSYISKGEE